MNPGSTSANIQDLLDQRSMLYREFFEWNRASFINDQKLFLYDPERQEVGELAGKTLLHLQCRWGLETLSLARSGAKTVGVDFDRTAIQRAKSLSQNLDAQFHCIDIYELPKILTGTFDIVYTSYGVLCWLHDLPEWGRIVARYLKPGGIFYLVDYHPAANLLDEDPDPQNPDATYPRSCYPYHRTYYQNHSTKEAVAPFEYRGIRIWSYTMGDVLNALTEAGLNLIYVHEHEYMFARRFEQMKQDQQGMWHWSDPSYHMPLLFSVKATH